MANGTFTLLEMTQDILGSMDSDEVNSISDTAESLQVATVIKHIFYEMASELDLAEQESLFELNASLYSSRPTLMTIPDNVKRIEWVKYNVIAAGETKANYRTIEYLDPAHFLDMQNSIRSNSTTFEQSITFNTETFEIPYRNDKQPSYYTSINDRTLLFDSYDATLDSTLQKSKTLCRGVLTPDFSMTDAYVPPLNQQQFSLLFNAAKERCFAELKQTENRNAMKAARVAKIITQYQKRKAQGIDEIYKVPRYGRRFR